MDKHHIYCFLSLCLPEEWESSVWLRWFCVVHLLLSFACQ